MTNKLEYELVDVKGNKVDLNAVPTGTDLYLNVPANVKSGEQKFDVSATGSVYAGKLLITKDAATTGRHGQTIIIGSNTEVTVSGTASFKWEIVPPAAPTPPASASTPPAPATTPSDPGDPAAPIAPTSTVTVTAPAPQSSAPSKKPGLPKTGNN